MKIVKSRIFKSFGTLMREDTYDNGTIMRYPTTNEDGGQEDTDNLDEQEEGQLEMQMNVQYLVDLTEINMEEE